MSAWTTRQIRRSDPGGNAIGETSGSLPLPCRCVHGLPLHEVRKDRTRGACSASGCDCKTYVPEEEPDAA